MSLADRRKRQPIRIPGEVCRDFQRSSKLEWLDTNHTGAFAMGTVAGVNTRRYHSLLLASLNPPSDRYSILSRVEEQISYEDKLFELAAAQYPGTVQPRGFEFLTEFRLDPFPIWTYQAGSVALEKRLCLLDEQQSVLTAYTASGRCQLQVRLFLSFRDYHSLSHRNDALRTVSDQRRGRLTFKPYQDLPSLTVLHRAKNFQSDSRWFLNHEYLWELDRGMDFREDLFSPGCLLFDIEPNQTVWFLATLEPHRFADIPTDEAIEEILSNEAKRREFPAPDPFEASLRTALDQFRITRADGRHSLIAGYPWFTDWSRDTLISFPAMLIGAFSPETGKEFLTLLLDERSQGILPNRFSDQHSTPEYNTVDATLWLFVAAREYIHKSQDLRFLREILYPAAQDILEWHYRGTHYNIHVDETDHLLFAGEAGVQLTWMDAKIGDWVVTPRTGKPVEINALFYNALRICAEWAGMLGLHDEAMAYNRRSESVLASFRKSFWNEDRNCLYDVVGPSAKDASIRPNQLFAVSLPFPLLDREQARLVVDLVRRQLLTPAGLRTLEPSDPSYKPRFHGGVVERDSAYHQGAVWPWLIGPFVSAYLYAYGDTEEARHVCRELLRGMEQEMTSCCLGSLSEVYDADAPQRPGGCPAQLWSIAQVLIAWSQLT
jgi:predicted glycogen debranching enzyme